MLVTTNVIFACEVHLNGHMRRWQGLELKAILRGIDATVVPRHLKGHCLEP